MDISSFLRILPHEMWCQILHNVNNAEDKKNVSNCLPYFRNILLDKRTQFLFPKVVNILVALKLETKDPGCEHGRLINCVTKKDVMCSRLVCSSWNAAVEACFERPFMTGIVPFKNDLKTCSRTINSKHWANNYTFCSTQVLRAQTFVAEMIEGQIGVLKNPFVGRFVNFHVWTSARANFAAFINLMTTILQNFGQEIWYVVLDIDFLFWSTLDERYEKFTEWLSYMPNLRSLQVKVVGQLEQTVIQSYPLPQLKHLIHLKISGVLTCVNVVNQLFLKYHEIFFLEIHDMLAMRMTLSPHLFTRLKGIYIKGKRKVCSELLHWIGYHNKIQTLDVFNHECNVRVSRQFQIFNKNWSESLTDLTLGIGDFDCFESKTHLNLKLPQLSRLKITKDNNLSLDFVQSLLNLKVLEVTLNNRGVSHLYQHGNLPSQRILFVGFETRMEESNIWNCLKKLWLVKINILNVYYKCYEYTKKHSGRIDRKCFTQV